MIKLLKINSITIQTYFLFILSFFVGVITTIIWVSSENKWDSFLDKSYSSGISIYNTIKYRTEINSKIKITKLNFKTETITKDQIESFSKIPQPYKITSLSIFDNKKKLEQQGKISLHIVSAKLQYPLAKIETSKDLSKEQQLGKIIQLVANYCTNPILFLKIDQSNWYRIDGNKVWGCKSAPSDNRLISIIILIISLLAIFLLIRENEIKFHNFIINLKNNLKTNKNSMEKIRGPSELIEISDTLDMFLNSQKEKLEKRLMVLSSISHDIGTPATKLKLRTALIEDKKLKEKLETDIDKMIDMMNGVLSYTRSEMDLEEEIEISYITLVESIVFDYQDLGKKVTLIKPKEKNIGLVTSVFSGNKRNQSFQLNQHYHLLVKGKPLSLQRAITNLIDNALKYGRTATLSLETTSETITLIIEDEGKNISEELLEALKKPFIRGQNIGFTKGTGLGLTIVSTIAEQHAGSLTFEKSNVGIRAKFMIKR